MASRRGSSAACLLWLLLLWSGDHGCQAQRAGCKSVHYDLVFLLDTSSSVGKEGFEKVRQWVANLVDTFEVGADRTRVGVVRYSDRPATAFELDHFGSRAEVRAAARRLTYHGGNTNTGDALRYITRHSFSPRAGGRPGDRAFKQVAILLTDGRSQDLVLAAATAAHRAGIRIFAVGVGQALREELEEIASEPKAAHIFHVSDFDAIDKIRGTLRRRLCESEWGPAAWGGTRGGEASVRVARP
ncbi:Collagen alpha-1 chain [Camelus dromedarius]|uniref:Collagen alpha-1 chain n=1 Tax=Camelus dromedarius TaxID=9838 RepID=A0A5N4CGN4_CAMDR|nr:Collagen alpha-1 chain [Camelus dromedarius]